MVSIFMDFYKISKYFQLDSVGIIQIVHLTVRANQCVQKFGNPSQCIVIVLF